MKKRFSYNSMGTNSFFFKLLNKGYNDKVPTSKDKVHLWPKMA